MRISFTEKLGFCCGPFPYPGKGGLTNAYSWISGLLWSGDCSPPHSTSPLLGLGNIPPPPRCTPTSGGALAGVMQALGKGGVRGPGVLIWVAQVFWGGGPA